MLFKNPDVVFNFFDQFTRSAIPLDRYNRIRSSKIITIIVLSFFIFLLIKNILYK